MVALVHCFNGIRIFRLDLAALVPMSMKPIDDGLCAPNTFEYITLTRFVSIFSVHQRRSSDKQITDNGCILIL